MYKHKLRTTFGSWDVEKVQAVVARSAFPGQNVQSTLTSDHFWKLRCQKKCRPLWREAHVQVKMRKAHQHRITFGSWDVKKVHAVVARSTCPSQKCKKMKSADHFLTFRCCFAWQAQGIVHLVKSEQDVRFRSSFNYNYNYSYNCNTLNDTTLHYTPLHSTTLHYAPPHYTTLH